MSYQNPNFNKEDYWKNKGVKQKKESIKASTPGAPLSIIDGEIVAENRAYRRKKEKGRKYSFYHRKGYYDELGMIKIKRLKHGKISHKMVPVTIDKP